MKFRRRPARLIVRSAIRTSLDYITTWLFCGNPRLLMKRSKGKRRDKGKRGERCTHRACDVGEGNGACD